MYKNKINNMDDTRMLKIYSNSSQNHQRVIQENVILHDIDNHKNIITFEFKEHIWCDKKLEDKRKLRYYKKVVNPNLKDKKYL
jgi:hypothetical protein